MQDRDFTGDDGGNNHATKFGTVTVHGRIDGVENLDAQDGAAGKDVEIIAGARMQASLQVKRQHGSPGNMHRFEGGSL